MARASSPVLCVVAFATTACADQRAPAPLTLQTAPAPQTVRERGEEAAPNPQARASERPVRRYDLTVGSVGLKRTIADAGLKADVLGAIDDALSMRVDVYV